MNYSRFEHVGCDEDEPDTAAAAAANERRKLEAAADAIPAPLREALGKMHIAADRGHAEAAAHARNSLAQMIRELPDSERPNIMAAIQRVILGTRPCGVRAPTAAAAASGTQVSAGKATQKKAPVRPSPEAAISQSGDVEFTGAGSLEDAREQLSHSLHELETAQKALAALEPSDTVPFLRTQTRTLPRRPLYHLPPTDLPSFS